MKKIIVFIALLFVCNVYGQTEHKSDFAAYGAAIRDLQKAWDEVDLTKNVVGKAKKDAENDSISAKGNANDVKWKSSKKAFEDAVKELVVSEKKVEDVYCLLSKLFSKKAKCDNKCKDDDLPYDAVIESVKAAKKCLEEANQLANQAKQNAQIDSFDDKEKKTYKNSWIALKNEREKAISNVAEKEKIANDAYILLSKLYAEKTKCHPVANGNNMGQLIIWITSILAFIVFITVIIYLAVNKFSLKEALSENTNTKTTIINPEYSAENMKDWLVYFQGNLKQLKDATEFADSDAKMKKAASDATPTDDNLKKAKEEAERKAVDAKNALDAASRSSVNPAVLANLGNLFPSTIDVSSAESNNTPIYRPSASRLIALLSGLAMIVIIISMVCFYIYYYLCVGCAPDLQPLSVVLLALGFGMAPYVVNKVANASTDKNV